MRESGKLPRGGGKVNMNSNDHIVWCEMGTQDEGLRGSSRHETLVDEDDKYGGRSRLGLMIAFCMDQFYLSEFEILAHAVEDTSESDKCVQDREWSAEEKAFVEAAKNLTASLHAAREREARLKEYDKAVG